VAFENFFLKQIFFHFRSERCSFDKKSEKASFKKMLSDRQGLSRLNIKTKPRRIERTSN
jgi:hypothetical protein